MTDSARARRLSRPVLCCAVVLVGILLVHVAIRSMGVSVEAHDVVRDPLPDSSSAVPSAMAAARDALATADDIDVAVVILDRTTGERAVNGGASVPVPAASLAKLILATDIVDRARAAAIPVDPDDLALLRRALGPSDDATMNALWTRFDGPGAVERISDRLGLSGTRPADYPASWGEMTTSALDIVAVLEHIADLPARDRNLLTTALAGAPPVAADGFVQAFGLLAPDIGTTVVAKQGWMWLGELFYLHTAGLVGDSGRYVVALLTVHGTALTAAPLRQYIDDAALAITRALVDEPAL